MESKPCSIVLLPNQPLAENAIEISRKLADHGTQFTLKNGSVYPHVSLYMFELKGNNYQKVQDALQVLAAAQSAQDLVADAYDQRMSFLSAEYLVTPALQKLQDLVIDAFNPLRNGIREKDTQRMLRSEGAKRQYFEKYGYPNVKELFWPHLTLTRFNTEDLFDTKLLPDVSTFSGVFDKIGFFESGDNGTCVNLIASYDLRSL